MVHYHVVVQVFAFSREYGRKKTPTASRFHAVSLFNNYVLNTSYACIVMQAKVKSEPEENKERR